MSFMKKQAAGTWATFITLILAFISVVIYLVNIGGEGYFQNASVAGMPLFFGIVIVMLIAVLALAQFSLGGMPGKVMGILSDLMRIVIPACVMAALMTLVSSRVEGFAFIYFSNEEVLQEVQTAANLSSAQGAIMSMAALAVTAIAGMVAAFFNMKKDK